MSAYDIKNIQKGDVFIRKENGKEYIFLGWWTKKLFDNLAIASTYRGKIYEGIISIKETDMEKHPNWIGGFMTNEGT